VGEERGVIINTASIAAFDARSARPPIRHPKADPRHVVYHAEAAGTGLPGAGPPSLRAAAGQLRIALKAIERRLVTGEHARYVRSSFLLALALDNLRRRHSPLSNALKDLTLLDGALAGLAATLRMEVADHDTRQPTGEALGSAHDVQ
jgi:hypothetical protein